MEENENKQEGKVKKEAEETINETKEKIKNINIKEEAQKGKGLIGKLVKEPIGTIKEIVEDEKNQYYKTAILIICIWTVIVLLKEVLSCIVYEYHTFKVLRTIQIAVAPILKILAMAIIIHILNKENKQTLTKAITTVAIAKIPVVIGACLGFLTYISSSITYITNPIASVLSIISTVSMLFVVKEMFKEEENEKALKTFIKVEALYYIVVFIFSFLGISL